MTPDLEGRVSVPEGVMFREIAGESVLLDLESETYYGLDEIGTRMWEALVGTPSIAAAHAMLLEEFDVDAGALRADLASFVARLAEAGLFALHDA